MTLAVVHCRAAVGIDAPPVAVEVHIGGGLPALNLVGLPEAAVKESRERVRAALLTSNFDFPAARITINLAPADLPKEGGRFDLPIAIGILAASEQLPGADLKQVELVGELALDGGLRPVRGVLPIALAARDAGRALLLPRANADEAALIEGGELFAADHLLEICAHLTGQGRLPLHTPAEAPTMHTEHPDLCEVQGQHQARRALEIAAAGAHSLLLYGPPGTGKTMLASRLPGILPPLGDREAVESAAVRSISRGGLDPAEWRQRPFRSPHHTSSAVALVGGGGNPRPGEISLAHHGVLFLDELPEFDRKVLEVLREPLEAGEITISRAANQVVFPARFQLVAAMNPCPCGYLGHPNGRCSCSPEQVARYRARISGPLLDRIDMHVEVPALPREALGNRQPAESSHAVQARVCAARARQLARRGHANAHLGPREINQDCPLGNSEAQLLEQASERLGLSARAYHRILKLARTIADLEGKEAIERRHLAEAIGYRVLDRGGRGR